MKPVVSQITDVLVQRLQTVTTANGYNQTLNVTRLTSQGLDSVEHGKCLVAQTTNLTRYEDVITMQVPTRTGRTAVFGIVIYLRTDDSDATPIEDVANLAAFDAIAAVSTADDWYKFGGLAFCARWLDIDFNVDSHAGFLEVVVGLEVQFITQDKSPATAA